MCGENRSKEGQMDKLVGSPPRVRGKHTRRSCRTMRRRITPACAGKTAIARDLFNLSGDHPRVCGENPPRFEISTASTGSPPRVRGKRGTTSGGGEPARITPACAGKTRSAPAKTFSKEDHPRVCGENRICSKRRTRGAGSPPRVRGKPRIASLAL